MILDLFTFCDELDLLELRLHELQGAVDRHVLAEAPATHRGGCRRLTFPSLKSVLDFQRRAPIGRLTCLCPPRIPVTRNPWVAENFQRNALAIALDGARPDDLLLVSDADEIPRAAALKAAANLVQKGARAVRLHLRHHAVHLNAVVPGGWFGPVLLKVSTLLRDRLTLQTVRDTASKPGRGVPTVPNAGWHFSWLGGPRAILRKANSFAHQETCARMTPVRARRLHEDGIHGFSGEGREVDLEYLPLDGTFPRHLTANKGRFGHLLRYC